jgi:Holliday junction resolvase RusA-like endonuclease
MGDRLGNEHPKVRQWRKSADAHLLFTRQSKHLRLIEGPVAIEILWDTQTLGDVDNRIKHCLDYLERLRVLTDDCTVRDLHVKYGLAPDGCRVRIRPWDWQS